LKEKELSYKGCVLSTAVAMALNGLNNTYFGVVPIMVSQAVAFQQGNSISLDQWSGLYRIGPTFFGQ